MNCKKSIILLIVLLLIISCLLYALFPHYKEYKKIGAEVIEKVENFQKYHDRLPSDLGEIGLVESMSDGPYYEIIDSSRYIVYFTLGFDYNFVYDSRDTEWRKDINIVQLCTIRNRSIPY